MKLIIAIVQDEDSGRVVSGLMSEGYSVTKLATTGGFLRAGNTTLLIGVDEEKFDGAMAVIEKICKSRKQIATSPSPIAGSSGVYMPYPVEVMVGGATIFVMNVEQFKKV
ncbi:MAG: cyclic-di-AMP receptor [Eubacteriales bacterium]|nr:cyclic-di-AMP receptor [Eubacteriales bacterium]